MATTASPHLIESVKRTFQTLLAILQTRLALLAADLQEARDQVFEILALAAVALFCFIFAAELAVLFVIAVFWDTHRLLAIGGFVLVFAATGAVLARMIMGRAKAAKRLFYGTRTELAKDRAHLSKGQELPAPFNEEPASTQPAASRGREGAGS